ncbi:hypothetical protein [Halostagnicola bangensis]
MTDKSDDLETESDATSDSRSLVECPTCGTPVALVTMKEPTIGIATPCGCHVAPNLLESN